MITKQRFTFEEEFRIPRSLSYANVLTAAKAAFHSSAFNIESLAKPDDHQVNTLDQLLTIFLSKSDGGDNHFC